jgi:hypothetical protein
MPWLPTGWSLSYHRLPFLSCQSFFGLQGTQVHVAIEAVVEYLADADVFFCATPKAKPLVFLKQFN